MHFTVRKLSRPHSSVVGTNRGRASIWVRSINASASRHVSMNLAQPAISSKGRRHAVTYECGCRTTLPPLIPWPPMVLPIGCSQSQYLASVLPRAHDFGRPIACTVSAFSSQSALASAPALESHVRAAERFSHHHPSKRHLHLAARYSTFYIA